MLYYIRASRDARRLNSYIALHHLYTLHHFLIDAVCHFLIDAMQSLRHIVNQVLTYLCNFFLRNLEHMSRCSQCCC